MSDRLTGKTLVIATGHDLSLALIGEGRVLAEQNAPMERGHAEALVPAIEALLAPFGGPECKCNQIIVEVGPGSFTGLRVGLAAATALSIAWSAKLYGVRSTQLVAAEARHKGVKGDLLVALGAPRGQVWVEQFAGDGLEVLQEPVSLLRSDAETLLAKHSNVVGAVPNFPQMPNIAPKASSIQYLKPDYLGKAEPLYVRAPDAA